MMGFIVGLVFGVFIGIALMCMLFVSRGDGNMPDIEDMKEGDQITMNIKKLEPSERGEIIWLSKSGYTPEAIARKLHLPLPVVKAWLRERGITCD